MSAALGHAKLKTAKGPATAPTQGILGLYFASAWCPDCTPCTPALKKWYNEAKKVSSNFEIVYVSSDKSASELNTSLANSHGSWMAIEFGDPAIQALKKKYGVCAGVEMAAVGLTSRKGGIPTLLIIDAATGKEIDIRGVDAVMRESPEAALKRWGA